jgi:pectate lyase
MTADPGPISNVILENLKIRNVTGNSMIGIWEGASNIWLDHLDLQNSTDERISINLNTYNPQPPTNIVISWLHSRQRDTSVPLPPWAISDCAPNWCSKSLLLTGPSQMASGRYTGHHNWFQTDGRNPHIQEGFFHSFNTYYDARFITVGGGSPFTNLCAEPVYFSENDIFEHGGDQYEPMLTGDAYICGSNSGTVKATNPYLINGASVYERNPGLVPNPHTYYTYTAETADNALKQRIMANAGWQNVTPPLSPPLSPPQDLRVLQAQ